jgi:hypothetical protein
VDDAGLAEEYRAQLWTYLEGAARSLMNSFV